ncbi:MULTISPECIES: hypothetical protein [Microbacterium]|uniref:Gram-positive cocci surface proteins LPxTG domain-containing protein n=1 Tax=Microbacterium sufflavum TaxID=2851649 RepID=A0ABY4IHQ6_9MICO|nr:hypothetical protein [Microbacterium sufflavum]MBN6190251.1 hypothetical protein [Aneurinibacillus sp. BA2021]MCK2026902.1 hypothetical protein [Microbacterium sufflavum]MPS75623.1 hypothetical protein [Microbacterium sp.]UPL11667.1 hypothetical protein KV394_11330 [Microbacterium sufflavum]
MLKKLAAISLTAGALVLVAPTIATAAPTIPDASSDSYPSPPGVKVGDPIIDVCEVSTIVFGPGYFLPSENVAVSVSGKNAGKAATSGNTAGADGSMTLTFRPPADGEGSYAVAFGGSRPYTATITVSHGHDAASSCDHDPAVAPAGTELPLTGGGMELALTGGSVSPWVLGGGAAALVAGGALVATGIVRRKRA